MPAEWRLNDEELNGIKVLHAWGIARRFAFNSMFVMIQRIVAGLGLSRPGVEFSACSKVLFFHGRKSFSQIGSMVV